MLERRPAVHLAFGNLVLGFAQLVADGLPVTLFQIVGEVDVFSPFLLVGVESVSQVPELPTSVSKPCWPRKTIAASPFTEGRQSHAQMSWLFDCSAIASQRRREAQELASR